MMINKKVCIFLRGINVNGIKLKMQDLKEVFVKMGFDEVKTILATGNVIITLNEATAKLNLREYIETGLSKAFNYDAHIIIRHMDEIIKIYNDTKSIKLLENHHIYVLLCESEEVMKELKTLFETVEHSKSESIELLKTHMLWVVPKGETLDSAFGSKVLGSKKYKEKLTSRNINTIEKIYNVLLT